MSLPGNSENNDPNEHAPSRADSSSKSNSNTKNDTSKDSLLSSYTEDRLDKIRRFFINKLRVFDTDETSKGPAVKILDEVSIDGIVKYIQNGKCKNIITLSGAGISTSAGIPDFRSPGSGLYHNLQKYNLPDPQAIFDIKYFVQNPQPFFMLAKELYEGTYKPTPSHYFIKLLNDKGILLRHYTQNIDTLERLTGLPEEKLIEAHGSFYTSHCVECKSEYAIDWKKHFRAGYEIPKCTECPGVIKPDIVLFGEKLPDRFHDCIFDDFDKCDLLIIMGSSLEVQPFASLVNRVPSWCPRVLINRERVGCEEKIANLLSNLGDFIEMQSILQLTGGFIFDSPDNIRDIPLIGNCDDGVFIMADKLGWGEELRQMVTDGHQKIDLSEVPTVV